jgi:hypothetical protein
MVLRRPVELAAVTGEVEIGPKTSCPVTRLTEHLESIFDVFSEKVVLVVRLN